MERSVAHEYSKEKSEASARSSEEAAMLDGQCR